MKTLKLSFLWLFFVMSAVLALTAIGYSFDHANKYPGDANTFLGLFIKISCVILSIGIPVVFAFLFMNKIVK